MAGNFGIPDSVGNTAVLIQPKSLTDTVQEKIADMIISGQFNLGQQLTESRLSEMFLVSKTPIREALLRLSGEGLIELKPRVGTFVFSLTESEIVQINSLRAILETGAIKAAMRHSRDIYLTALHANLTASEHLLTEVDIDGSYRKLDREFHELPFRCAGNPYLLKARNTIAAKVWALRNRLTFPQPQLRIAVSEHREIVCALDEGRIDNACKLLEDHIAASFTERAKQLVAESAEE